MFFITLTISKLAKLPEIKANGLIILINAMVFVFKSV